MSYSVNSDTKVATYEGAEFKPKHVTSITTDDSGTNTQTTVLVAPTEEECKEMKALRDAAPTYHLQRLREKRNALLSQTDWIVAKSLEAGEAVPDAWKTYRQQLRDITTTYQSVSDDGFTWPTEPS